jgi:hypothetical protein
LKILKGAPEKETDQNAGSFCKSLHAHQKYLICVGLALLTIAIYFPALDSLMVADDFIIVNRLGLDDAILSLHNTVGFERNEYRPLIAFSYAISNSLWNGSPRGYHFDNILLHSLNVIVLFFWLLLLTRSAAISVMAAALFAVHPIHAERVIWITARDSLFSTFFSLLALLTYSLARVKDESDPAKPFFSAKTLIGFSCIFYILSLLSYEGAVVILIIIAAMELFIFAQPEQKLLSRLRSAAVKTRWHTFILILYLTWWALLFRGKVGPYNLSYTIGSFFHNYYSYLYHLFHGNSRLAGVLYFLLLLAAFFLPRERRSLAGFLIVYILVSFVPFVVIIGFADRFAYAGAAGYAALIALLIYACSQTRHLRQFYGRLIAFSIFAILAGYYWTGLHSRIYDWRDAGQIADCIPRQIKMKYPDLKDGAILVLRDIPQMHGHAYVYPLGLESAVARLYPGRKIQVFYRPGEINKILEKDRPEFLNALFFNYVEGLQCIEETRRK